ncbi:MAG: dephospho-CoA kinase [Tannerella sp.]|jgi:dephospho-CoA kinase|nr:dephospho-CoA kinase [Tannerella sp.]
MIRIGLTGGIGSGKSVVASLLQTYGIPIYIADQESKKLLQTSPAIREQLITLLGNSIYEENRLNRQRMASLIFNDAKLLKKVNNIIHPQVASHFNTWAKRQNTEFTVLESAILFESGFTQYVDISLMVYAPMELRIKRTVIRDNTTETEVLQRIKNQLPDEEKKEYADYIINNDDNQALIPQTQKILASLSGEYNSGKV